MAAMVVLCGSVEARTWKKHTIMEQGHCNTAVALDVNGDKCLDVIASFNGRVSLFVAPDWKQEVILYRFPRGKRGCIHSSVIDADGDGDLDWAGSLSNEHPFWLENPGKAEALKGAWTPRSIDPEITGIHCLLPSDIDNDGRDDLVINNFAPEEGLGDSMAWFRAPKNPLSAKQWERYVFADGDARGGNHYMGAADVDGDGWREIAVGAKGKPFADGNWFAFWTNPGKDGVRGPWKKTILAENQLGATNILPGDMKQLMNKVTEAAKAAEANLIARREETAAIRNQANTAKLLEGNPVLMRLRELEILERIAATSKLQLVLGEKGLADRVTNLL